MKLKQLEGKSYRVFCLYVYLLTLGAVTFYLLWYHYFTGISGTEIGNSISFYHRVVSIYSYGFWIGLILLAMYFLYYCKNEFDNKIMTVVLNAGISALMIKLIEPMMMFHIFGSNNVNVRDLIIMDEISYGYSLLIIGLVIVVAMLYVSRQFIIKRLNVGSILVFILVIILLLYPPIISIVSSNVPEMSMEVNLSYIILGGTTSVILWFDFPKYNMNTEN